MQKPLIRIVIALLATALSASLPPAAHAQDRGPTIFAAASLKNGLDAVNEAWKAAGHQPAVISYAASSALAKQIENGAPADIFLSADLDWMDYLAERKLIKPDTRLKLLGNHLVLIAPADSAITTKIEPGFPLADLLGDGKLSMADTDSVPAGKYGKASLAALKVWNQVSGKVAQAENVRAALLLVSRKESPLGIVYETDAFADKSVKIVDRFPENTHPPIIYPAAILANAKNGDASALFDFLKSTAAKKAFEAQGFSVLAQTASAQ